MDLENPSKYCNSVCSIALLIVNDNKVVKEISMLINPEDEFGEINSRINKITKEMVKDSPTIDKFFNDYKDLFSTYTLVGHNAHYDLTVLAKALYSYGIDLGEVKYLCTWELSEKFLTESKSHKLHNLCEELNYTYDVHEALSDTHACLFLYDYLRNNYDINEDECIKTFKYKRKRKDIIRGENNNDDKTN
ncbi:MAG: hypothetical protein MJ245_07030 [Clostridia bacterium]|nr:hypothetical protein [Clostridia bacterium]